MITSQDIQQYVLTHFSAEYHDAVVDQILKSRKLLDVFNSAEGQAVLSNAVEDLSKSISKIVSLVSSGKFGTKEFEKTAYEAAFLQRQITRWATVLLDGEKHIETIRETKND